jgi:hypothetical protein
MLSVHNSCVLVCARLQRLRLRWTTRRALASTGARLQST